MSSDIQIAVASSFDICHFRKGENIWPHKLDCKNIELFAFMHQSLPVIFPEYHKKMTVLKALASMKDDPKEVKRIANFIHEHFKGYNIVTVSSYLPEIGSPEENINWQLAQAALIGLVLLVEELRETHLHPCRTLLLVSGSRYDGMWAAVDAAVSDEEENNAHKFRVVNMLTTENAIIRLVNRLTLVAEEAKSHNVYLAISMEPGPFFTIGNWESILTLCGQIENSTESVKSHVGLNLDLAHWAFLSNINAETLNANDMVKNRIIHAQISDQRHGHCCDAVPMVFHKVEEYLPWLQIIRDLSLTTVNTNQRLIPFSGYISCEHEAANVVSTINTSVERVMSLLQLTAK